MTESEAWDTLLFYAQKGRVRIAAEMTVNVIRRSLAKVFHPRLATDDDRDMRAINACIDVVEAARDKRELCGEPEPAPTAAEPSGRDPWQSDPYESTQIFRQDYTDINFLKKTIYDRSIRFGKVELVKAWAWDGARFRKVVSLYANDWALEELGRALLFQQTHGSADGRCDAVFLTQGQGRVRRFRLILLKSGRYCEDVSKCGLYFESEPDDPQLPTKLTQWLHGIDGRMWSDRTAGAAPPASEKVVALVEAAIYVNDLEQAEAFYHGILGLAVIGKEAHRHVFFQVGSTVLLAFNPAETMRGESLPWHGARGAGHFALGITAESLPAWRLRLKTYGVAIEKEFHWPKGGTSLYFRDPAGNSVELITPGVWGLPGGW